MEPRAALVEQLLGLAWSHWTALGVAGAVAAAEEPIDLEALMILTADLAADDPRLRDESLDWCSQFHGFCSKPRLKQLLRRSPPSARSAFGAFAHALEQHAGGLWPGATRTSEIPTVLSGKSRLPPLGQPALLSLRLRALFGVGARADIIGALILHPSNDFGAADLVSIGYSKRNLAAALDMLAASGLFRTTRAGNRVRFSWQKLGELAALLEPLPTLSPLWTASMRVMSGFLDLLTRVQRKSDRLYAVEAAGCFQQFSSDLHALGIDSPAFSVGTPGETISDWVLATTAQRIRPQKTIPMARRASR